MSVVRKIQRRKNLVSKGLNKRLMLVSKCALCGKKKSRLIKNQEPSGFLKKLGIKTPLSNVLLIGRILFED